jgi:hypothetical protein
MARAYGSNAHLLMKRETAYGQAATGNYIRMPFNRCNLGSEQGLIDDPVLGQGRDPRAPLQDVINDEGDIVVPVDPRCLGLWLTGLFGDPNTTDNLDGSWDHEFTSGGDDLPSYTLEVGMPKVPAFFVHAGVKLNSIALEFTRFGPAAATISAIAQGETRFGTTQGGTPTSLTFSRISQFQGSIKRAGSPVENLTGGSVTYSNNLEKIETIRDDGLIEGADPTIAALTGRIDVRFADTTLIDLAAGGTRSTLSSPTRSRRRRSSCSLRMRSTCPSPSLRSRVLVACRRGSTSGAQRTMSPGGCSPLPSPTTSMDRCTHDAQRSPQACPQFGGCSLMIELAQRSEPYEIALPYGLAVTVKPLTTAGMAAAQAAARRAVEAIERQARERTDAGLPLDGLSDLSAQSERDGFYQARLIRELAVRHVASWTGVELGGGLAPPTPENIAALMELYPVGERFLQR